MMTRSILAVLACLVVIARIAVAADQNESPQRSKDPKELAAVLNAGFEQWLSAVQFKSSYELTRGRCRSVESALRGELDSPFLENGKPIVERGICNKLGRSVRYSKTYSAPAKRREGTGDSSRWSNVGYDEVIVDGIAAMKIPSLSQSSGGRIAVARRSEADPSGNDPKAFAPGPHSESELSPLSLFGGPPTAPVQMQMHMRRGDDPNAVKYSIADSDKEHVAIRMSLNLSGELMEKVVEFWMAASPPVVSKITFTSTKNGQIVADSTSVASDFVDCPGGKVPKQLVYVVLSPAPGQEDLKWLTIRWRSSDLGAVLPSDEDFVLTADDGTAVRGLKSNRKEQAVNLKAISDKDLKEHRKTRPGGIAGSDEPKGVMQRWLLIGNLAAVGILILLYVLRSRFKKKPL